MRASSRGLVLVDLAVALAIGALAWVSAQASRWTTDEQFDGPWRRGGPPGRGGPMMPGSSAEPWTVWSDVWWPPLPFVVLLTVGLAIRRIRPRTGFCLVAVGVGGYLAVGGVVGPVLLAPPLAVYAMSVALPIRVWAPWTALLVPMLLASSWSKPLLGLFDPLTWGLVMVGTAVALVPALFGLLRRNRIEVTRAEHEAELRRYAYEERLRVARDVHDVVGHGLSVISMQAGVALHVLGSRPEQAAESLTAIRDTSRQALAELRATLDVYRDPEAPLAPAPGLARLPDLVAALGAAGRVVTVDDRRTGVPVSDAVDLAALRIVQESLTNVVRHTDAAAAVTLDDGEGVLTVTIRDDGPTAVLREGSGIAGMRERARAVGGTLGIETPAAGGVRVTARLPLTAASAVSDR